MPPNTNAPASAAEPMRQIVEQLANANNVLITVSNDPSVDQLAACIGLTVALNKQGKHATAVFSGTVPSTLEFLQPEKTIEKNTNSLRDFIISLDKSKADKLRYKVEDEFVKIFITPYRTSLDGSDLAFSQGDFNIDLVITLGVHERQQLDAAIVAHGRILHDAPVVSLNTDSVADLGSINWVDTEASSLCEMAADLVLETGREELDSQIATSLLTGMVAETDRFGNEKATPHTMAVSGILMAAGASTQLISNKLEEPIEIPQHEDVYSEEAELPAVIEESGEEPAPRNDGIIEIDHSHDDDIKIDEHGKLEPVVEEEFIEEEVAPEAPTEEPEDVVQAEQPEEAPQEEVQHGYLAADPQPEPESESKLVLDPPQLGGQLTANSVPEHEQYSPAIDPLAGNSGDGPLLDHTEPIEEPALPELPAFEETPQPEVPAEPEVSASEEQFEIDAPEKTLSDLEKELSSPHAQEPVPDPPSVDDALADVQAAINANDNYRPEPISALGATDVGLSGLGGQDPMEQIRAQEAVDETPEENKDTGNTPPPVPPPFNPGV